MPGKINIIGGMIKDLTGTADKLATSDHEISKELTARQVNDLTSPFRLPHLIRPVSFLIALGLQVVLSLLVVILAFVKMDDPTLTVVGVLAENSILVGTMAGFYFQSRKNEKIAFKNAEANIKLESVKLDAEIKHKEIELKQSKWDARVQARLERKQAKRDAKKD